MFSWFRFLRRKRDEQDLDAEINAHLATEVQQRIERGESSEEAHANARKDFGNVGVIKEVTRQAWGNVWLHSVLSDLRFALRNIARRPSFALLAILTTAFGIGAATATFSMLDTVLLRPLPYKNGDRLVSVMGTVPSWRGDPTIGFLWNVFGVTYSQYESLGNRKGIFDEIAIYGRQGGVLLGAGDPRRVRVGKGSAKFFSVLGVHPLKGRLFQPEDEDAASQATVILSHELWQSAYGGNPDLLGRTVRLGKPHTVIGILPANFEFADTGFDAELTPEIWIPIQPNASGLNRDDDSNFQLIGVLTPSVSPTDAEREVGRIFNEHLSPGAKGFIPAMGARIVLRQEQEAENTRGLLVVLFGASGLLLVIACGNVANLLLGQASVRGQEIALRSTLGATRFRIARQLITESLLLSLVGGAIGCVLAVGIIRALVHFAPTQLPHVNDMGLDWRVLLFSSAVALVTGVSFGLAPALTLFRTSLNNTLKESGRSSQMRQSRLQDGVLVGEISLSFVLLVVAGLLSQSFSRLTAVDVGFQAEHLLSIGLDLPESRYPTEVAKKSFYAEALPRLAVLPGVETVTMINETPFAGGAILELDEIEGKPRAPDQAKLFVHNRAVLPNYFSTVGASLIAGRTFTAAENTDHARVMIVNRTMAETFWPGESPLNKRVRQGEWYSIVGVVEDLREVAPALTGEVPPTFYLPGPFGDIILRTVGDSLQLALLIREQIRSIDADLPIRRIETLSNLIATTTTVERYRTILVSAFALAAVALALIGLYGVISRIVIYRTQELGIRMALGATPSSILELVLQKCLVLSVAGVAIGAAGALAVTRLLTSYLFAISATDAMTYGIIAIGLIGVSLMAGYIPARRAARIDPVECLRRPTSQLFLS